MELRLNKEGMQYILGLPVKDDPVLFSQVILSPGELEWLSQVFNRARRHSHGLSRIRHCPGWPLRARITKE